MVNRLPIFILMATILRISYARGLNSDLNKYAFNNNGKGSYSFEYITSDGSYRREDGGLVAGPNNEVFMVRGEYGYIDPDGRSHSVHYVADENGFQPISSDADSSEDVELRRIFPSEFPQDVVRKSGSVDPEQLGRYAELENYFKYPRENKNSHFEELICRNNAERKVCTLNMNRYLSEEDSYYKSRSPRLSHMDRRRVYCFMLICFTEGELNQVIATFK